MSCEVVCNWNCTKYKYNYLTFHLHLLAYDFVLECVHVLMILHILLANKQHRRSSADCMQRTANDARRRMLISGDFASDGVNYPEMLLSTYRIWRNEYAFYQFQKNIQQFFTNNSNSFCIEEINFFELVALIVCKERNDARRTMLISGESDLHPMVWIIRKLRTILTQHTEFGATKCLVCILPISEEYSTVLHKHLLSVIVSKFVKMHSFYIIQSSFLNFRFESISLSYRFFRIWNHYNLHLYKLHLYKVQQHAWKYIPSIVAYFHLNTQNAVYIILYTQPDQYCF